MRMSKKVTGVKVFEGENYYSFQGICREFIGNDGRLVVDDFVRVLTKLGIFKKIKRECVSRNHYQYLLTDKLSDLLEGNYIIQGSPSTQRLYFNNIASELLFEIYNTYKREQPPIKQWDKMIEGVVSKFIEEPEEDNVNEVLDMIQVQMETIQEELNKLKEIMNTGITNVNLRLESLKLAK